MKAYYTLRLSYLNASTSSRRTRTLQLLYSAPRIIGALGLTRPKDHSNRHPIGVRSPITSIY